MHVLDRNKRATARYIRNISLEERKTHYVHIKRRKCCIPETQDLDHIFFMVEMW